METLYGTPMDEILAALRWKRCPDGPHLVKIETPMPEAFGFQGRCAICYRGGVRPVPQMADGRCPVCGGEEALC